ncbi:MAG: hypothetical protein IPJ41_06295 [Phycisphaerales bacterium]|nr:hypothetical protein [Phycisphaerales bacterium]
MQDKTQNPSAFAPITEPKLLFRADTDQNGDWYVWRQLSTHGWATMRRCGCREEALELAATMNKDPGFAIFHS